MPLARVAILLSGRGSNYLALQTAVDRGEIPAEICLVISNVSDAPGLDHARDRGVSVRVVPHREQPSRAAHEEEVLAILEEGGVEWVCLAGYMRILTPDFVGHYRHRILNIHPSLLPSFPGLHVHQATLEYGVKVSGCTVHLVDASLDNGPIVVQRTVPVQDQDSPETLASRILEQEHQAYPEALRLLLTRDWKVEGRRVLFEPR